MEYNNKLISSSLTDTFHHDEKNKRDIYDSDCHNLPICKSYGEIAFGCCAGAYADVPRCSRGNKILIRIANDSNPNAIYKPEKPDRKEITEYING